MVSVNASVTVKKHETFCLLSKFTAIVYILRSDVVIIPHIILTAMLYMSCLKIWKEQFNTGLRLDF